MGTSTVQLFKYNNPVTKCSYHDVLLNLLLILGSGSSLNSSYTHDAVPNPERYSLRFLFKMRAW